MSTMPTASSPVILNVDDTATTRTISTHILRQAGFRVVEATSGCDALRLAQQRPHLVLLDINLPDINGREVCRQIKEDPSTAAIPVVHLSACYTSPGDRVTGLEEGADGYLTQPVDPSELVATVRAFLRLKQAERAQSQSERWHRTLFEHSHDALITVSPPTWLATSGNPAARGLFGISAKGEFPSLAWWDLAPNRQPDNSSSETKALVMLESALRDGTSSCGWTLRDMRGSTFPAHVSFTRIDFDSSPIVLVTIRDESDKKNLEASLGQADRLACMGMLAASLGHELNNPLAYVHFNLESLAEDVPALGGMLERFIANLRNCIGNEILSVIADKTPWPTSQAFLELSERVDESLGGVRRMKAMTQALGMFSRVGQSQLERCDLHGALESAIKLASNELTQRARLVREYSTLPAVCVQEGRLSQVFLNLLINAGHAIEAGDAKSNQITVRTWIEGPNVCAEVRDTGRGIPTEHLERIFDPFFTTKGATGGTGLGLSICKSIMSDFGGELSVQSEVSRGTSFVLRLPATPEHTAESATALATRAPPSLHNVRGRILIVDDEESIRRSLRRLLSRDYDVVALESGEAAQALLQEDAGFDAIVCDLMMDGMSGTSFHAWLAERNAQLAKQVLFITGGAFVPSTTAYMSGVTNPVLRKPVDSKTVRHAVAQLVELGKNPV